MMTELQEVQTKERDYSLVGKEAQHAITSGLADAQWYQTPIPRAQMNELLIRKDWPAIRDTVIWLMLISGSGYLFYIWWGTWLAVPAYIVYSLLYASSSDSRWHESSHGTAFKTDWMNDLLYELSSFMVFRQSTVWRWSHARHHSDTIIRGRDPEISMPRPPRIKRLILGIFGLAAAIPETKRMFVHAFGKIDPEVATYVPPQEHPKVIFKARIYLLIYFAVICASIYYQTILPLMFIGLPTILGGWLMRIYGWTQHAGLQENVLDHRLNSRTVYMNRIHRFLYWNMNYHIEHHMFPLVPYHALPRLHQLMKDDCPPPYHSILDAYQEIIPAIFRQMKDTSYYVKRPLPEKSSRPSVEGTAALIGSRAAVKGDKIFVCPLKDLPLGEAIRFDLEEKTYAIYRTAKDQLYATDGFCTHGNAHLADGAIIGDMIECQKHNGRFSLVDGSPKRLPVCQRIMTHPVETHDGQVWLQISAVSSSLDQKEGRTFRVVSNKNVATFIKELTLEPVGKTTFTYRPGQYIQMIIPPHKTSFRDFEIEPPFLRTWKDRGLFELSTTNQVYARRNYSLADRPSGNSIIKLNISIALPPPGSNVNAGVGSTYAFALQPGALVKLTGPFGDFLIKDSDQEMIYLGGGAGMAPLRAHLSSLFETDGTSRKISFWYGARTVQDLYYRSYFEALQENHPNFSYHTAVSEPLANDQWQGFEGFIHEHLLSSYLAVHSAPHEIEYYICGPPAMLDACLNMLNKIGVAEENIAFDVF